MITIYSPLALKLHSFGLVRVFDSEWCGEDLYQNCKRPYRGQAEPTEMFKKTIKDGFLVQLGHWLFDDFLGSEEWFDSLTGQEMLEYLDDLVEALQLMGVSCDSKTLARTDAFLDKVTTLHEKDEDAYYTKCERRSFRERLYFRREKVTSKYADELSEASVQYASNYAERVFHDRELCGYLATLILDIGIDGTGLDEEPSQWVNREKPPEWAKKVITARDRGHCAMCNADLTMELLDDSHFDHIVPISKGGCNDLVNYQLTCTPCNLKKRNDQLPVRNSVPGYMRHYLRSLR